MKYAVIDIGTNSIRLMIAEVIDQRFRVLEKKLNTVRIGEGMGTSHRLKAAAIKRTVDGLDAFVQLARQQDCQVIKLFATSAVREAENRDEFLLLAQNRLSLQVEVISGEEEASLGFAGAANGRDAGIIDIGGGSTEIMVGRGGQIEYRSSFPLGTVKCLSKYPDADAHPALYERCCLEIDEMFAPLRELKCPLPFLGIGGTATALSAVLQQMERYDPAKIQGSVLTVSELTALYQRLISLSLAQRKTLTGLEEKRADVIPFGCLMLLRVMDALCLPRITVSDSDNLEGYLIKMGLAKQEDA